MRLYSRGLAVLLAVALCLAFPRVSAVADTPKVMCIPDGMRVIGDQAFAGVGATGVFIPESVTYISPSAFPNVSVVYGYEGTYARQFAESSAVNARFEAIDIKLIQPYWKIAPGEAVRPVDDEETRDVSLVSSDPAKLSVDGDCVVGVSPGVYTVTASTVTEFGAAIRATVIVEVYIPVETVIISALDDSLPEGGSAALSATVMPENASYPQITWSSQNEDIATIDENGLVTALSQGKVTLRASAEDKHCDFPLRVVRLVSGLEITPVNASDVLYTRMTLPLTAIATPSEADDTSVTWSSEDSDTATIDAVSGVVTGHKAGDATIIASANDGGGATAMYTVNVLQGVEQITLTSPAGIVCAGETAYIRAQTLPATAQGTQLTWTSDDISIAAVDAQTGQITGVAPGACNITATSINGVSASVKITVGVRETKVESALSTVYLNPGNTSNPYNYVFVYPQNATYTELSDWSSSNASSVKIDANTGRITALSAGSAVITGKTHFGLTVSFTVRVVTDSSVITSQSVSPSYLVLNRNASSKLAASCKPTAGNYIGGVWYSDNKSVATVSNGTVYAVGAGTANIHVIALSGVKAVCTVLVKPTVIRTLTLSKSAHTLNKGESFTLTPSYTPATADDINLEWSSSAPGVAGVDKNGRVTALSGGAAVITAITEDGVYARCTVTVNTVKLASAILNETQIDGNAGETYALTYTYLPENATPATFNWTSDNEQIARVDASTGLVTLVSAGKTTVRGAADDGSGVALACEVTVAETPVTGFKLNSQTVNLSWNETFQLVPAVTPEGASHSQPVYTSLNEDIATVSQTGLITAVSKGKTSVTATVGYGAYARTLTVSVNVTSDSVVTYRALVTGQFTNASQSGFLPFSTNGTRGVSDALRRSVINGNRYSVNLLGSSPSPSSFRSAITTLSKAADTNDVTVIFFLTHGSYNESNGSYVMQMSSDGSSIAPATMINALKTISGHVVFILCTCNSGRILSTSAVTTLMSAGGAYTGLNGAGRLSILCSSTNTVSSFYNTTNTSLSRDFFTYALTRGLGWDMIGDVSLGSPLADANNDGYVTLQELATYSRVNTQRAISAFIQLNGTSKFSGHASQYPGWKFGSGEGNLILYGCK